MAGLSLSLLGPFSAALDHQELSHFRTRLAQALLIYLVCQPERHRREQLMALLWPDLSQTAAQQNLRQNLYYLRKAIPEVAAGNGHTLIPLLLTDYHTVQLNPQAAVQLDVRQFSTLIEEGWTDQQQLVQAVALYRGDFLVDFYLPDSNPFEEWAVARRESYRRQLLTALERLATHALTAADYPAAESYARQQLAIDPLHEAANRQLIEILARSGRRSAALAHYDEYQRLLKTELGVEPGSETLTLLKAVQTGELHPTEPTSQRPGHIRSYQLQEELGRGSFGVVYRAFQPAIGRHVAIKVIPAQFADDPTFIRRFESEAQFIARLEHPQIVPLYDYWREPGSAYLVMRYLRGGNLKAALQKGAWSLAQVAQFLQQVAAALHTAHRNGIVHRDVKPANILLDEAGNAYLSDFGIAKLFQAEEATGRTETLTGTPEYLSPEQINNYPTTPLSDQYSLGVVVYELLNGRPPFIADSIRLLLEKHIYEPLPLISQQNPDVPAAIDEVLQRATAKTPEARFPDIAAFADAFAAAFHTTQDEPLLTDHPVPLLNVTNPYQGLLPFTEADAALFFGRDTLIQHLLPRLTSDGQHLPPPHPVIPRFLAIIGPSGSGKSSLVKAGLVPALRGGAIPGSESWFILDIIPGSHPFEELETALLRIAVNPPTTLLEQLQADQRGLLRAVRRVLPAAENSQLLLIIDQFEELFTLVTDRTVTARFLDALYTAITDPRSPLRVIITLRADFYDRPLLYPGISELLQHHTEIVIPLTADELVQAIERPASLVGAYVEPELVAALVADVNQQPGALPLLQHTLSELFEQRQENRLLLSTYRQLGGISGALAQRAEAVFDQLDQAGQAAARNLFLRLVTLGEGVEDTRRRVLQAELLALDVIGETRRLRDWETPQSTILEPQGEREQGSEGAETRGKTVNGQWLTVNGEWEGSPNLSVSQSPSLPISNLQSPLSTVLDLFGRARLLSFDRDPVTRGPTVEIAHEALLRAWPRLRQWMDESRAELRLGRLLTQTAAEWEAAGRDNGFLLRGARLNQLAPLIAGHIALTNNERLYLKASLAARDARQAAEEARRQEEIATAQRLAETERQRAAEQSHAARRLRQRAALLAAALVLASILALAALLFGRQAQQNAVAADSQRVIALAAEATAETEADVRATAESNARSQQAEAENQARLATSRELSQAAINSLETDPELSILLALRAVELAETKESQEALHQAIQASRTILAFNTGAVATVYQHGQRNFAITPDSTRLATANSDEITIWETNSGTALMSIPLAKPTDTHSYLAFNGTGDELAFLSNPVGRDALLLYTWEFGDQVNSLTRTLPIQLNQWSGMVLSPDWSLLAVGYENGTVDLWDTNTSQRVLTIDDHQDWAWTMTFNEDGSRLATASPNGQVFVWNVPASLAAGSAEALAALMVAADDGRPETLTFVDDNLLAVGTHVGAIQLWDTRDPAAPRFTQHGHNNVVHHLSFNSERTQLASASEDGNVKIWNMADGELLLTLDGPLSPIFRAYFNPAGTRLTTVGDGGSVRVWNMQLQPLGELTSYTTSPLTLDLKLHPTRHLLATGSEVETPSLWDSSTGQWLRTFTGPEGGFFRVAYSPDGTRLAGVGRANQIRVWDVNSGETVWTAEGHGPGVVANGLFTGIMDVAYSPDGSRLVTAGADGVAKVWDAQTGAELLSFTNHTAGLLSLAYSPDGRLVATTSIRDDATVRVWSPITGEEHFVLRGHSGDIWGVAFTPDSTRLATGGDFGMLKLWDMATGEELYTLPRVRDAVFDIVFTPDGEYFAITEEALSVWHTETGEEHLTLYHNPVYFLALSRDGRHLYVVDIQDTVQVFTLRLEDTITLAHERLTRWWRPEECEQYLHTAECPPAPPQFAANE